MVGVARELTPMKDRRLPSDLKLATRGVGAGDLRNDELGTSIIVDGVWAD